MVLTQPLNLTSLRHDLNRLFYSAPVVQPTFAANLSAQSFGFYGQAAGIYAHAPQFLAHQGFPAVQSFGHFVPKANWAEAPECTFLTVELPGVELSQVSLRIEGAYLILEGVRHPGGLLGERMISYNMAEGRFGAFRWICPIPAGTVPAHIEASFRNGLLQIVLPKAVALHSFNPITAPAMAGATAMAAAPSAQVVITPGVTA